VLDVESRAHRNVQEATGLTGFSIRYSTWIDLDLNGFVRHAKGYLERCGGCLEFYLFDIWITAAHLISFLPWLWNGKN